MDFTSFDRRGDSFTGNPPRQELKNLPPGCYTLTYDQNQGLIFNKVDMHYDKLIDLPSPEYDYVMKRINTFLSADSRQAFDDYGFLYKWNCMLYGTFGTGKTCIVNRVAEKVIGQGGIVIFSPDPRLLPLAYKMIDDIQKDRTTMVILEEFETLLTQFEGALLSLLDGEIQKNNIIYMATTNHLEQVPSRLMRPGRFATILEVKFPSAAARTKYLTMKLKPEDHGQIPNWVAVTVGLSIDELKETVLSVKCFHNTLEETVDRILGTRRMTREAAAAGEAGRAYHTEEMLDECESYYDQDGQDAGFMELPEGEAKLQGPKMTREGKLGKR